MNEIVVFLMVLFTSAGAGVQMVPVTDKELCQQMVTMSQDLVGKKVKGPNGDMVLVIDAQAECKTYTQQKRASL